MHQQPFESKAAAKKDSSLHETNIIKTKDNARRIHMQRKT
jgi:hypothetical protein